MGMAWGPLPPPGNFYAFFFALPRKCFALIEFGHSITVKMLLGRLSSGFKEKFGDILMEGGHGPQKVSKIFEILKSLTRPLMNGIIFLEF